MEYEILTGILKRFTIYLEDLPANLRLISHTLLFFLATIDIALTVYNNIDNENFSYYKWIKSKILKLGFIVFAINQYEWLLAGVKDFFFDVAGKAIRTNLFSNNEYFENPSELYSKGADLAAYIYKEGVSWYSPKSWIYIILSILIIIGFLMLAVQLIICWIEYYFLTGISIIFLPFGALDVGLDFYKNVFKTIMSCSIKLAVMNFWLRLSTVILNDLFKLTNNNVKMELVILIFGTLYVIVAIMQFMPSMTSGLLTGTPAVNASAAMAGATGAAIGMMRETKEAAKGAWETAKGAWEGGKTGAKGGAYAGGTAFGALGSLAGPVGGTVGAAVGKVVGGAVGTVAGAAVGGSYAGARYAIFKEKAKDKVDSSGNTGGSSKSASNQQNASSNGSGSGETTVSSGQSDTSSNIQSSIGNRSVNSNSTNTSTTQTTDNAQSAGSNTLANTNSAEVTSNAISQDTGNNVGNSNNDTTSTVNTNTTSNTSSDTGDSSGKRGVKVNGGEAGRIPEWMKDDY